MPSLKADLPSDTQSSLVHLHGTDVGVDEWYRSVCLLDNCEVTDKPLGVFTNNHRTLYISLTDSALFVYNRLL